MEFLLLFIDRRGTPGGAPRGIAEFEKFAGELARQGKLRRAAPLLPDSVGALVRVRDGKAQVSDGPFSESQEIVGGFWSIEAANREEAIEIARRALETGEPRSHAGGGVVEVHRVAGRWTFAGPDEGTSFLLAFRMEPQARHTASGVTVSRARSEPQASEAGSVDPDGSKMREMTAFGQALAREGTLLETAPLAKDSPEARIEARGTKTLVIDGPFTETKEVIGGYSIVRVASRAEAIELAKRYPHAKWGAVEVRQVRTPYAIQPVREGT